MLLRFHITFFLLISIFCANAQNSISLENKENGPFFNVIPVSEDGISSFDKVTMQLYISEIDTTYDTQTIFISDAEIQELHVGNQVYYTGKYQNTKKLTNRWDYRHFTVPTEQLLQNNISFTCSNITKGKFTISPSLVQQSGLENGFVNLIASGKKGIIFTIFFLGAISIFLVYTIGLTIQTNNPDFKFYAYYLGSILLHNAIQADAFLKIYALFPRNPIWYHNVNEFLQMFIYAFFMLFIKVFLDLETEKAKLSRFVDRSIIAIILFAFVFLGTAVITKDFFFLQNYLSILWLVVATLGAVIVVGVTRNSTNPVRYYILIGSIFLLIGSFLELYSSLSLEGGYNWNLYATTENQWFPFNYTQAAILLETICFALGIGYKIRMQGKERNKNIDLEKKLLEKELSALRSQMNPHFLFNSLNSVNNYIMKEKPQVASKYLTRFSQLMRTILNNSKEKFVNLDQELEAIRLYVELENLRFKQKFDYKISMTDGLAANQILIPSMIIQPYIENAIKHGLIPMEKPGQLQLIISESGGQLNITIDDNGIGRAASLLVKNENDSVRKSHGMEITSNRIDLLNKIYDLDASIHIEDKAQGTCVKLTLKLITDEAQAISGHRR